MYFKLDDLDLNILSSVDDCIGLNTSEIKTIDDEKYIDKDILMGIIQEFVSEYRLLKEGLDDYKENYRPIGNESGWDMAFLYQKEMENEREFLEEKGLWEEYKEKNWKVK